MKRFIGVLIIGAMCVAGASLAIAQSGHELFQRALAKERAEGNLTEAIKIYERIVKEHGANRPLAAKALFQLGQCYEKLGKEEARKAYERILREFGDQAEAAEARTRLAALRKPTAPATMEPVARQVWAGPEVDYFGVPSADGRFLPVTDWSTGDLALRDLAAGQTRRLTNKGPWMQSAEFAMFPVPSPDGRQVAYTWFNKEMIWDLRVMGTDGSAPRVLSKGSGADFAVPAGWTPDGKHIAAALVRGDGASQAALLSVADGSVRVLKTFAKEDRAGHGGVKGGLSPDGRFIAYDRWPNPEAKQSDIFLLSAQTGKETPLVQHPANDFFPVWTPDGKAVLFTSDRSGTLGLWLQQVSDGKPAGAPQLVKPDAGRMYPMGFTQKGQFFYGLDAGANEVYIASLDIRTGELREAPAALSQRYVGSNSAPAWSPDGKYLAYRSHRGAFPSQLSYFGSRLIVIRSAETGQERDLPVDLANVNHLHWSPDGRAILLRGEDGQGAGIFRVDAQTGEVTTLIQEQGNNYRWPALSPDGQTLFYLQINQARRTFSLRARKLQSNEEKELLGIPAFPGAILSLGLSPDGQQLAVAVGGPQETVLKIMPAAGGEPREIYRMASSLAGPGDSRLLWTPDGKNILFTRGGEDAANSEEQNLGLWQVPVAGGEARKLGLTMERLRHVALHPDGTRLAFAAGQPKLEVWVMENFLPVLKAAK
jgi:Tol biopolymer transport system component